MQSLRSWFSGTAATATTTPLAPASSSAASAASESTASASSSSRSARSASFSDPPATAAIECNIVEDYASCRATGAEASASASPAAPRKRSWRDVAAGFASSSASSSAAAAESDAAFSIPALAPLLRSTSSMSSDVSLLSARSVSPFTLSSSDDFRSDDDEGELVADLLAADPSADSLLFDLAEEKEANQNDEEDAEEDETAEHFADHASDGDCRECMEHAAFEAAEAQYEASSLGRADFKLRPAVYDADGKFHREVSFPFGKAHGQRLVREQQALTRQKRERARWPKDTEKVSAFYKRRSYDSKVALQRAAGTCDDCARIGEVTDPLHRRRRGCNCALKERRADELQRRNCIDQLKNSRLWPLDPTPELPVPYSHAQGQKLQLRPDATVGDGSCNLPKRLRRQRSSAPRDPWAEPDKNEHASEPDKSENENERKSKSAAIKAQRAATQRRMKQAEASRAAHIPKRSRPTATGPKLLQASKRYMIESAKYESAQAVRRESSFEGLRQHLFKQLQSEGIIDSIRSTHDATLMPVALHLAPVDSATVRQFMHERNSDAPHQRIDPCFALTATPSQANKPWMRAWSDIQTASNPPAGYSYDASEIASSSIRDPNPNRRYMLIGLGIRRELRHTAGSPPTPAPQILYHTIVRGGAHQGCISRRRTFSSRAVVLLPLFVLEYEIQPFPLDAPPHSQPISKHQAQRLLGEIHSRRKLMRRVPDNFALPSCLFDLVERDDRWEFDADCTGPPHAHCCSPDLSQPAPQGTFAERLAADMAAHKAKCDTLRMEELFMERSLIVKSQLVAPTWDERRSTKFRRSAGIYN